jgi:hypothetical protein
MIHLLSFPDDERNKFALAKCELISAQGARFIVAAKVVNVADLCSTVVTLFILVTSHLRATINKCLFASGFDL